MQEYYDSYACYLMLEAYSNDSSKTLVNPTELRIFSHRCICRKELFQATRFDWDNNECKYKFLLRNLVQTLLIEFSQLSSDRCSFDHSSDHSSDKRFDNSSKNADPRPFYTPHYPSGSSPAADFLPEHQNDFLTKVFNAVKIDPRRAFTPGCICCLALNMKIELRNHILNVLMLSILSLFERSLLVYVFLSTVKERSHYYLILRPQLLKILL